MGADAYHQHFGSSPQSTADETLCSELALRGYDLSKLRNEDPQADVLKIG